ncbi:LOW QUALITY PROTEIN: hypothetical protein ACHAW6_002302 [Cyclotella cf. meneghiniana]
MSLFIQKVAIESFPQTNKSFSNCCFILLLNIYEYKNTGQRINFYYTKMGYPVISTWIKAIDKDYFRRWRGLTSDHVRHFIKSNEQ